MLRLLKRLHLWWLRYGEGPSFSRIVTIGGSLATILAVYFHKAEMQKPAAAADTLSLVLAWIFGSITSLVMLRWVLLLRLWPWRKFHPGAPIVAQHLTDLPPEPGKDAPYRFVLADSPYDLKSYVSESEYFLGESNPGLARSDRHLLYERWLALSPKSFLYLLRTDRARPVALSIILPLSEKGYQSLYGQSRSHKKVIDFGVDEIARRGPYRYLLVDTFIISKKQERDQRRANGPTGSRRYGRTLLLRHLAIFWKDAKRRSSPGLSLLGLPSPQPVAIIAETDKDQLIRDLLAIGFRQKGKSAIGCPLFEFDYPQVSPDTAQNNLVNALVDRVWQVRKWKIQMSTHVK